MPGNSIDTYLFADRLASHGYLAFSPSYRLAPEHPHPVGLSDLHACLRFLREQTDLPEATPGPMAAFGIGAGAYLAAMLSLDARETGLIGFVGVDGLYDLTGPPERYSRSVAQGIALHLGGADLPAAVVAAASPIFNVGAAAPPSLLIQHEGEGSVPSDEAAKLCAAIRDAGATCHHVTVPLLRGEARMDKVETAVLRFLASVFNP
jgi:acetyl esterase/lipase